MVGKINDVSVTQSASYLSGKWMDRCSLSWASGRGWLEVYWGWTDAASAGHLSGTSCSLYENKTSGLKQCWWWCYNYCTAKAQFQVIKAGTEVFWQVNYLAVARDISVFTRGWSPLTQQEIISIKKEHNQQLSNGSSLTVQHEASWALNKIWYCGLDIHQCNTQMSNCSCISGDKVSL